MLEPTNKSSKEDEVAVEIFNRDVYKGEDSCICYDSDDNQDVFFYDVEYQEYYDSCKDG